MVSETSKALDASPNFCAKPNNVNILQRNLWSCARTNYLSTIWRESIAGMRVADCIADYFERGGKGK